MANHFEQLASRPIPFMEGAAFLQKLKTAGWTDPPDVTGGLEGGFTVSKEEVLDKLKQVIAAKARLMLGWYTYAQSFKGDAWRAIKTEFHEHAGDEQEGLTFYLKRAAALGGPIHMDDIEAPPPASDPLAIFNIMARAEQEGILAQRELRDLVGEENPMKIGIEEQMSKDQHHLDEMWQMMPQGSQPGLEEVGGFAEEGAETPPVEQEEPSAPAAKEEKLAAAREAFSRAKDLVLGSRVPGLHENVNKAGLKLLGGARGAANEVVTSARTLSDEKRKVLGSRLAAGAGAAGIAGGTALALRDKEKKAAKDDSALKETGRERAVTNMAAEAHREQSRRGERAGSVLGGLGGAAGGAVLGNKYLKGNVGRATGATLGYLAGSGAGKELGTELDIRRNKAKTATDTATLMRMFPGSRGLTPDEVEESYASERHSLPSHALGGAALGGLLGSQLGLPGAAVGALAGAPLGLGFGAMRNAGLKNSLRNKTVTFGVAPASKTAGVADVAPAFGGLSAGYGLGGTAAEETAQALAPRSQDRRAGDTARRVAMVAAPVAGLGAMVAAHKLKAVPRALHALERFSPLGTLADPAIEQEIAKLVVPAGAALGGSLLGGGLAGGVVGAASRGKSPAPRVRQSAAPNDLAELLRYENEENTGKLSPDHPEHEERAYQALKAKFGSVLRKLAFGEMGAQPGPGIQPSPTEAVPPPPAGAGMEQAPNEQPQMAAPPGTDSGMEAMHFLAAEQAGREAQEQTESAYYREKLREAAQQLEQATQGSQEMQVQLEQLQQQTAEVNNDISERTNQAVEANVEATRRAQEAANLRIGIEKMRQQLLGVAAQDPEVLAQTPTPGPMDPGMEQATGGMPDDGSGSAEQAASPEGTPGTTPAGAGESGAPAEPAKASGTPGTVVNVSAQPNTKKEGSIKRAGLKEDVIRNGPWALGGAALGGLGAYQAARTAPRLRSQVESMTAGRKPGDFEAAKALSQKYKELHDAEHSHAKPAAAALAGAMGGGLLLGSTGPAILRDIQTIKHYGLGRR